MNPCPASCASLEAPGTCAGPCVEGCASLPGYAYSGAQSLPRAHCGCTMGGRYYQVWAGWGRRDGITGNGGGWHQAGLGNPLLLARPPLQQGESFVSEDCSQRCTCARPGLLQCQPLHCGQGEICTLGNLTRGCFRGEPARPRGLFIPPCVEAAPPSAGRAPQSLPSSSSS